MNKLSAVIIVMAASIAVPACSYVPSWAGGEKAEKQKLTGERVAVLPVVAGLEADATLKNTPLNIPASSPNDSWTQHGGGLSAVRGNIAAGGNFDTITDVAVGNGEAFVNTQVITPVIAGGLVFAMDQAGNISAHDVADITAIRWQSKGVSREDAPPASGGGLAYDQGKLYVVSGRGAVAAFDAVTGTEIWRKEMHLPFRSAPKIAAGKLFAITIDNQTYALNLADGSVVWTHRGISETTGLMNSVSPVIDGDMIVVPYSSGEVYALSTASGSEVWSESLSANKHTQANSLFAGIGGDPIVDGGVVFSVSNAGMITVQGLGNGQRVWERPIGSMNTPWIAGEALFMLTTDNTLLNIAKYDGRIRWATKLQSYEDMEKRRNPITWKGPVLVDGKLAVVGSNGQLLLVAASDGSIVATQSIPENIYMPPVVAGGRMYLVDQNSTLYSLK